MRIGKSPLMICLPLVLSFFVALQPAQPRPPKPLKEIGRLLPVGRMIVDVMQAYTPIRQFVIGQKLSASARAHPDVFKELLNNAPRGKPMAYDSRMGISAEEYAEFLSLKPYVKKLSQATLTIKARGSRRLLDGGTALSTLTGIQVDVKTGAMFSLYGNVAEYSAVRPESGQVTGPWEGICWRSDTVGRAGRFPKQVQDGGVLEVGVGRLTKNGKGMLFCSVEQTVDGALKTKVLTIVEYRLTAKEK